MTEKLERLGLWNKVIGAIGENHSLKRDRSPAATSWEETQQKLSDLGVQEIVSAADLTKKYGEATYLILCLLDWQFSTGNYHDRETINSDFTSVIPPELRAIVRQAIPSLHLSTDGTYVTTHASLRAYVLAAHRFIDQKQAELAPEVFEAWHRRLDALADKYHIYW